LIFINKTKELKDYRHPDRWLMLKIFQQVSITDIFIGNEKNLKYQSAGIIDG